MTTQPGDRDASVPGAGPLPPGDPSGLRRAATHAAAPRLLLGFGAAALTAGLAPGLLVGRDEPGLGFGQLGALAGGAGSLLAAVTLASPGVRHLGLTAARLTDEARAELSRFAIIIVQLAGLLLLIREFRIESPAFYDRIAPLVFFGFLIHHILPRTLRLPCFVLLSLLGILLVLGVHDGTWLIGVGGLFLALCHAPVAFRIRVAVIVLVGFGLALLRTHPDAAPWRAGVWPVLGSMFMFRLIVYLYDLRHKEPVNLWRALGYFFLLPNVAFPLFPVVDYATFRRTYYDQNDYEIYQRGLRWMLRGVAHLVLYRFAYQHLTVSPADVDSMGALARYILANFLLYVRVSGQFHLIVGMLHLFGFRLPETHRFFYLASSFTDFWRRINIYWKDFMMKVLHFPVFFRLKKRGPTAALIGATFVVFLATWAFHAYQWFWLLGSVLLSWTDVLFWVVLGALCIGSALREVSRGRVRTLKTHTWTLKDAGPYALKTVTTFTIICLLWSLWTSPTFDDWLALFRGAGITVVGVGTGLAGFFLASALLAFALISKVWRPTQDSTPAVEPRFWRAATVTTVATAVFFVAGHPATTRRLGVGLQEVFRDLRVNELNRQDAAMLQRGYYENLAGVNRFNSQLWEVYAQRPSEWPPPWETDVGLLTGDFLYADLRPLVGTYYLGQPFRTNRWAMRDRDYDLAANPGTVRVAFLGPSYLMGAGVGDGETFEWLLEDRLNHESVTGGSSRKYEILNFGMGGWTPAQQLAILEDRVFPFHPSHIFMITHPADANRMAHNLWLVTQTGAQVPYPFLADKLSIAGVDSTTGNLAAEKQLKPYEDEMLSWVYQEIVRRCRERGIVPVWVYLSMPTQVRGPEAIEALTQQARQAGFEVMNLADVYDGFDPTTLRVAPWDNHPNARAHRMIADRFYQRLREQQTELRLPLPAPADSTATR